MMNDGDEQTWRNMRDTVRYRMLREVIRTANKSEDDGTGHKKPSKYMILVLDRRSTRILNSVLRMYDITSEGLASAEPLEKPRRPFHDLEAIYIIEPTASAVKLVCDDFPSRRGALYAGVHIFFTSKASPEALALIKNTKYLLSRIKTLCEMNIDFLATEMSTFHLDMPDALVRLYGDSEAEGSIVKKEECRNAIVKRLVTLCASLHEYPYIRYRTENELCTQLATDFYQKFNEFVSGNEDFWWKGDGIGSHGKDDERGTLLLIDRTEDTSIPLLHTFTYQAMINDLLDVEDDVLRFTNDSSQAQRVLMTESDDFWVELRHCHMVDVLSKLKKYADDFQEVDYRKTLKNDKSGEISVEALISAVQDIPEFGEIKEKHLNHLNISARCMQALEDQKLLKCADLEQTMVAGGVNADGKALSSSALTLELMKLVKDPSIGVEQTTRLLALYVITQKGIQENDRRRIVAAAEPPLPLDSQYAVINLSYLGVSLESAAKQTHSKTAKQKKLVADAKKLAKNCDYSYSRYVPGLAHLVEDMIAGVLSTETFRYVIEPPPTSMNNESIKTDNGSAATLSVRSHGIISQNSEAKGLNGKLSRFGTGAESLRNRKKSGARIIIFIAGGVTHAELQAMYDLTKNSYREVVIGSTHMLRPSQFLFDLKHLDKDTYKFYEADIEKQKKEIREQHKKMDAQISGSPIEDKDGKEKPVDHHPDTIDAPLKKKTGCGCFGN